MSSDTAVVIFIIVGVIAGLAALAYLGWRLAE